MRCCIHPGGEEIEVGVGPDGSVAVTDRGPGIPVSDREHVFERFWRGAGLGIEGAGLGLSITKDIMARHAGSVLVEDNPPGGTIVVLSFNLHGS